MSIYRRMAELHAQGKDFVVATVIRADGSVPRHEGTKMLVLPGGGIEGTVGGGDLESRVIEQALEALESGEPKVLEYAFRDVERGDVGVCGGEMDILVEPVKPVATVVVVGGGHVGKSVAELAHWLGYRVVVSDDRAEYATAESVPEADETIHCKLSELPARMKITDQTYVLLTTRGVEVDIEGLPKLLETEAAYIGVIGSRRRWEVASQKLLESGASPKQVARVVSPMGLELNAETPEEIALSMMAQIVMLRRGGSGESMAHQPRKKAST